MRPLFVFSLYLCGKRAFACAFSAAASFATAESTSAADTRESLAALSGISRHSTPTFMPFQRLLPGFPPVIAAA